MKQLDKDFWKMVLKIIIYALTLVAAYLGIELTSSCTTHRQTNGKGIGIFHYVDTFHVDYNRTFKYPK